MGNFIDILTESKKTYKFKIRYAGEVPEHFEDRLEMSLKKYDLLNLTKGKTTPIAEKPLDFPQLQNLEVTHWETEVNYPITSHLLQEYIVDQCNIDKAYIVVRGENDPIELQQDEIGEEKPYEALLDTEDMGQADKDAQKKIAGDRVMDLLKELQKERSERTNDPMDGVPKGESKDIDSKENSVSPVGSK